MLCLYYPSPVVHAAAAADLDFDFFFGVVNLGTLRKIFLGVTRTGTRSTLDAAQQLKGFCCIVMDKNLGKLCRAW